MEKRLLFLVVVIGKQPEVKIVLLCLNLNVVQSFKRDVLWVYKRKYRENQSGTHLTKQQDEKGKAIVHKNFIQVLSKCVGTEDKAIIQCSVPPE